LGIIEQRTSEILQAYAVSQVGQPNEQPLQLPSVGGGDGPHKLTIQPPAYDEMSGDDSEGEEEDERPLTRQELEKKTLKEFTKKGMSTSSPIGGPGSNMKKSSFGP
jgi:hypothetical protein